jgi:hypothetical protein
LTEALTTLFLDTGCGAFQGVILGTHVRALVVTYGTGRSRRLSAA